MKRIEVSIKEDEVTVIRETEEHLTRDQKYTLLLVLAGTAGLLLFFWMMTGH